MDMLQYVHWATRLQISDQLRSILKSENIITRPSAGHGSWLLFLLPISIILTDYKVTASTEVYHMSAVFCETLALSALKIILNICQVKENSVPKFHKDMLFPAIISCVRLYISCERGIIYSLVASWLTSFGFVSGVLALLRACPKCFTFGEASIVVQSVILFLLSSVETISRTWINTPLMDIEIATVILQVGMLGIILICGMVYFVPAFRIAILFYSLVAAILFIGVIPMLHLLLNTSPVLWIIQLLISDAKTILLIMYWLACSCMAVGVIMKQIEKQQQASTVIRKYFHILAVVVYIPGLVYQCCLLYFASGMVLAIFIMLELLRIIQVPPLGFVLQEGFVVYADEKDAGNLALTPIYLLAGCSLPLWLHPSGCTSKKCLLPLLSGLLSVGIGDTLASVVGTWIGQHKWPGSKKTVEGTVASIVGEITVILLMIFLGVLDFGLFDMAKLGIAVTITSLLEAHTDQVDNLALPLFCYALLI